MLGAVLVGQHHEWQVANRCVSREHFAMPLATVESKDVLPKLAAAS